MYPDAFVTLKNALCSFLIVAFPQFGELFVVDIGRNNIGTGVPITQKLVLSYKGK